MNSMVEHTEDPLPSNSETSPRETLGENFDLNNSDSHESKGTINTKTRDSEMSSEDNSTLMESPMNSPDFKTQTFSEKWTACIKVLHGPLMKGLLYLSGVSAKNPKRTISLVCMTSVFLVIVGLLTNFYIEVEEEALWTPTSSNSAINRKWLYDEAQFPAEDRYFAMFFHADGNNVVKREYVLKVFDVLDTIRNHTEYNTVCADSDRIAPDGIYAAQPGQNRTCEISGIPAFWAYQRSIFEQVVRDDTDLQAYISAQNYADLRPVTRTVIMGNEKVNEETGIIESAESFTLAFLLPDTEKAAEWDVSMIDVVLNVRQQWVDEGSKFRVEVYTESSFSLEFERTIFEDLPLIPAVFLIMSGFTALVFAKRHKVESRSILGLAAVVSVLLSIMTGYGLMFVFGVPFTAMTQLLPFLVFGIGLDDAFMIMGEYTRTNQTKDPVERIHDTIAEVGLSITVTTATSATAFALGCSSSVPAVVWLVLYAFPTIIFVLLYQLTFFVACITLDEKRISDGRRDWCCCVKATDSHRVGVRIEGQDHVADRFMGWFAVKILQPRVRIFVLVIFGTVAGLSAWSASKLRQGFAVKDVLPGDSYFGNFLDASEMYTQEADVAPALYFRFVDQSDPDIHEQMSKYIDTIVGLPQVSVRPKYFWLDNFQEFINTTVGAGNLTFNEQVDLFLDDPVLRYIHYDNIYRDAEGNVIASRFSIEFDNVGYEVVNEEIDALKAQYAASATFPINQNKSWGDWPFITYDDMFNAWEFYAVCVDELILSTVIGVAAVTLIAALSIPHWSAAPIIFPFICVLYIDLLGFMQIAGVQINAISYIGLTMSIGLLVDYIMHGLLRFYEVPGTRREKCITMMRTVGSSILLGGISTFLGTLLLAFASSDIFYTVFIVFLGIVVLGVSHGLILLPVVLSMIGPEDQITMSLTKGKEEEIVFEKKVLVYI